MAEESSNAGNGQQPTGGSNSTGTETYAGGRNPTGGRGGRGGRGRGGRDGGRGGRRFQQRKPHATRIAELKDIHFGLPTDATSGSSARERKKFYSCAGRTESDLARRCLEAGKILPVTEKLPVEDPAGAVLATWGGKKEKSLAKADRRSCAR